MSKLLFVSQCRNGYTVLNHLISQGEDICGLITVDPGRVTTSDISAFAEFDKVCSDNNINYIKIKNMVEATDFIMKCSPDLMVVMGWSRLIPEKLLNIPRYGAVTCHPTLLPEGRGRSPIPWTILKGLKKSGVTMISLDKGADTGDIIGQVEYDIDSRETATTLYEKSIGASIELFDKYLPKFKDNSLKLVSQDKDEGSFWEKRVPKDGLIDWSKNSREIDTLVRAVTHPYPGAYFFHGTKKIIIWSCEIADIERGGLK